MFVRHFLGNSPFGMSFKNYYAVLGVAPNASEDDIKKKFRKLALLYHPDRNGESEFAAIRFREIQEAYEILCDQNKRTVYNRDWRNHYPKVNTSAVEETTPESILLKCQKIQQDIKDMDSFRINQQYIKTHLDKLLGDENMALLLFHNNIAVNRNIIMRVLEICNVLTPKAFPSIQQKLEKLAQGNFDMLNTIEKKIKQLKYKKLWEKYYPLLAFVIAVAACIFIYIISLKK